MSDECASNRRRRRAIGRRSCCSSAHSSCRLLGFWRFPPFRGIDEFDHAYRASSVAHGHWRSEGVPAENGRGYVIVASRSVVDAAYLECHALRYTGPDNCSAIQDNGDGTVTVASAAARYHPLFYWLIGTPSMYFDGATALYVMRAVSALMCAAIVGASAFVLGLWIRTKWPIYALLASMTPVLVYSTSIVAPNGIEMVSGILLWVTLLGLSRRDLALSTERTLVDVYPAKRLHLGHGSHPWPTLALSDLGNHIFRLRKRSDLNSLVVGTHDWSP